VFVSILYCIYITIYVVEILTKKHLLTFFRKKFFCQHSGFQKPSISENQKGLSKNAECPANVKAAIKLDTVSIRKKDPFIKVFINLIKLIIIFFVFLFSL